MTILLSLALGLVVLVLFTGLVGFAVNGPWYRRHANHLMNLRVAAQAVAVLMLAVAIWLAP